jgi:hypothetical protein
MSQRDDDDGQVDGDASPPVMAWGGAPSSPFATQPGAQPWLRNVGEPPWHVWGGSQVVRTVTLGTGDAPVQQTVQLCKISYKRPETWNFLFVAKILSGTRMDSVAESFLMHVRFDVMTGLGRSAAQLFNRADGASGSGFFVFQQPGFENYEFGPGWPAPGPVVRHTIFSTSVYGPNRTTDPATENRRDNLITELVGQDIQVNALVTNLSNYAGTFEVEVSAFFAPKVHVRPEWLHPTAPLEQQYPGDEIGGR